MQYASKLEIPAICLATWCVVNRSLQCYTYYHTRACFACVLYRLLEVHNLNFLQHFRRNLQHGNFLRNKLEEFDALITSPSLEFVGLFFNICLKFNAVDIGEYRISPL